MPENFAYGLAHWLEHKLQSTEQDNVGELLAQWVALRQEDDESFDAYRARVNHLLALLDHAKEKPSADSTPSCCSTGCSRATGRLCSRSRRAIC